MRRSSRLRRTLRARREAKAAWARSRRDRLAAGPEAAASWELALMGALVLRPRRVLAFAATHPPAWFTSPALELMKALYCRSGAHRSTAEDLIETLESHGTLTVMGGADAVRALVAPRPELDRALLELDALLSRLPGAEQEQIARAEDLDDLDALIESGVKPTARSTGTPDLIESGLDPAARSAVTDVACAVGRVDADEQLTLFQDRSMSEEDDHA